MSLSHLHYLDLRYRKCQAIHFYLVASFKTQLKSNLELKINSGQNYNSHFQVCGSTSRFFLFVSGLAMLLKIYQHLLHVETLSKRQKYCKVPMALLPVGSQGSLQWRKDNLQHRPSLSWHMDQMTCSQDGLA